MRSDKYENQHPLRHSRQEDADSQSEMEARLASRAARASRNKSEGNKFRRPSFGSGGSGRNGGGTSVLKRVILIIVGIILAIILIACIYAGYCVATAPKINTDNIYSLLSQSSVIYDSRGKKLQTIYAGENRTKVSYKDMPEDLTDAFVALEDKTFWKHHGFNFIRIIGALKESVFSGGSVSGTSTLTQQLARNVYLKKDMSKRSMKRKIREAWYTVKLEQNLSKEQILEAYLNTIALGFNSNGVQAASQAYFSKDVSKLTLAQCATLAALPQAPTTYAPVQLVPNDSVSAGASNILKRTSYGTFVLNSTAKKRRNLCLKLMLDQGKITEKEYKKAVNTSLRDELDPDYSSGNSKNNYFTDYVISRVIKDMEEKYDISYQEAWKEVYTGGLKIYSTMDRKAQKVVNREFKNKANFPNPVNIRYDGQGNILSKNGTIILRKYDNYFNDKGTFTLSSGEAKKKSDGSLILKHGKRLKFYKTSVNGTTDYSIEFPDLYLWSEGHLYSIAGGYINIPAKYKSMRSNGDVVIAAEYIQSDEGKQVFLKSGEGYQIRKDYYSLNQKTIQPQAAMTIIENKTGRIRAMAGGRNVSGQMLYNRAITTRQPGSSIKPLGVYSAALQQSADEAEKGKTHTFTNYGIDKQGTTGWGSYITAGSVVVDEPTTNNGRVWPKNSGGGYSGRQTVRTALKNSINTCAYKIFMQVGTDYSSKLVKKYGITSLVETGAANDMNAAALALGGMTKGVSTLEMANAYTCFAGDGTKTKQPICYTKVVDSEGEVKLKPNTSRRRVIDESVAWIMRSMMQGVVTGGTGTSAAIAGERVGGKTGTTSDQYDIWFDGYTAKYTASLWIGSDVNIMLPAYGSYAAGVWGKIMRQIPNALGGTYPSMPSTVEQHGSEYYVKGTYGGSTYAYGANTTPEGSEVTVSICPQSGMLATSGCPNPVQKTYNKSLGQNPPTGYCTIHSSNSSNSGSGQNSGANSSGKSGTSTTNKSSQNTRGQTTQSAAKSGQNTAKTGQ